MLGSINSGAHSGAIVSSPKERDVMPGPTRAAWYEMAISISWFCNKSIGSAPEVSRIVMSGFFLMNPGNRGLSHFAAKLGEQCSANTCALGASVTSLQADSITSNTRDNESRRRRPSAVGSTVRFLRRNRALPKWSSRSRIWWLMADWVRWSSLAASVKLSRRAAASKARNRVKFGIFLM